jgi:hypothetical protein
VYGIYFLDMLQPILNGSTPSLSIDEMSLQITPELGTSLSSPSLFIIFQQLLHHDQEVMIQDKFQALLLLVALIGEVFQFLRLRHSMLVSGGEFVEVETQQHVDENIQPPTPEQALRGVCTSLKVRQQSLEAAHCRWKGLWDSLDQVEVEATPLVYQNAMPFYIVSNHFDTFLRSVRLTIFVDWVFSPFLL